MDNHVELDGGLRAGCPGEVEVCSVTQSEDVATEVDETDKGDGC